MNTETGFFEFVSVDVLNIDSTQPLKMGSVCPEMRVFCLV